MHDIAQKVRTESKMKSSRGTLGIAIGGVVALLILLAGIKALQIFTMISAGSKMVPPPETVTSAIVQEEDWAPVLSAIGSISPVQGAVISTELPGTVAEVPF
jgi:membrane fusion protein (multidrug efflux system)